MFIYLPLIMDESELGSFVMWFAITGIVVLITGFSYRAFSKKNKNSS